MSTTKNLEALSASLDKISERALAMAKELGADDAKVSTSVSFQKRLVVENKEFTLANSLESRGISLLVHKDKKKGSASLNSVDEAQVRQAVEDALALAKYSVPDEFLTLSTRDNAPNVASLPFMYDESLAELDLEEIQGQMAETLARLTRDKRVALDRYEMACDVSWHGLANSHGVRQTERQSIATWSFFGMARDGEEVTGFDYDGSFSFGKKGLQEKQLEGAEQFAAKILAGLKPRKAPSYKGPVVFSPRAVQELLFGMILYHASGRQVMDGRSKWDKSVGQKVVSDKLTLTDHPHDPRFAGATAFDGDGLPTKKAAILSKGVLNLHLHDLYSAKKTGGKSSAHAGGPFALELATGPDSLESMLKTVDNLLLVDRFSGNSDPVKGDFSGVAKSSRLFVNGKDAGAVTETMIAGNFFDLAQHVLAVSNVAEIVSGAASAPYVLVDGISVTGEG